MKKFVLGLIMILVCPSIVLASDVDVKVTDYLVDAYVLDNGDMEVRELVVAEGTANWFERDLLYANSALMESDDLANNKIYNASDITNLEIKAKKVNSVSFDTFDAEGFESFTKVTYASNGSLAKYTVGSLSYGYRYRMFYRFNNDRVAFYIKYTVKDAVVLHDDVAELYWTFIPDGFEEDLKNVKIKVHLPGDDNTDNFRVWAHGNLSGEIYKNGNSMVQASIDKVLTGESVDVRLTFDKNLVSSLITKKSNIEALDKIIEVEEERALVANNLRKKLLAQYNFIKYGTILMYVVIVFLAIYIYKKYGKSPKSGYYAKYNREFIDDYNVEVIDYLMNKKITPNAMSASIMNLIYKKNISAFLIEPNLKKKSYEFILENMDNINDSEKILIEFLFDTVGKGKLNDDKKKTFTTKDLKNYASGVKTCETFISSYTKWKNSIMKLGEQEKFYEIHVMPKLIGIVVTFIGLLFFVLGMLWGVDFIPTYFLLIFVIMFFLYAIFVDKKTVRGAEHYDKWKAFKNFLNDFGAFQYKELPEIVLWERYLVYATIFGLAEKVQKSMNVHIKELEMSNASYDYMPSYVYIDLGSTINSSINNAINSAYSRQAANYSNSHSSSSSGGGFGGGFSSGGGFGGGGGGGRFG